MESTQAAPNTIPNTILIIRLSAIGDVIMASAILPALKSKYPNSRLVWLAEPAAASLLSDHPLIDKLIILPRAQWRALKQQKQYRALYQAVNLFIRELKQQKIDWAIDLQGLLKSGIWAWLSRAKRRIGLGSKEASQWLMTECVKRVADDPRMCSEYQDMAEYLGLYTQNFEMSMPVSESESEAANSILQAQGYENQQKFVVFCPFTTRAQKHWIDQYWLALAKRFAELNWPVVILGGPSDAAHAERLSRQISHTNTVLNLTGKTSLKQAASVIKQANLLIGVDTGLTHMGIAQKTPTLAIFGSTFPYTDTQCETAKVVYKKQACAPCRRTPICDGAFTCMWQVTPDMVWQQAKYVIKEKVS